MSPRTRRRQDAKADAVEGLAEQFAQELREHQAYSTEEARHVRQAIVRAAAACRWKSVADVNRDSLVKWLMQMRAQGKARATQRNVQSRLKLWCDWLVSRGIVETNPLEGLKLPRVKNSHRGPGARAFNVDEVRVMILAAEHKEKTDGRAGKWGPNRSVLYAVLMHTGLRYSEAMRLRWSWIDWKASRLKIKEDKAGRGDTIPLHPESLEALRQLREHPATNARQTRREFVFMKVSHHSLTSDMERAGVARRVAEGQGGQWHAFRKGLVTELLRRGAKVEEVQKISRHHDVNVITKYYNDLRPAETARIVEKMPNLNGFFSRTDCSRGESSIMCNGGRAKAAPKKARIAAGDCKTGGMEPGGIEPPALRDGLEKAITALIEQTTRLLRQL